MGDGAIKALSVATLVVLVTLLAGMWDTSWNAVAYVTGDHSWRTMSVKRDDMFHGFSMKHRITLRNEGLDTVRAKFAISNTSDTPIGYVQIDCDFDIIHKSGYIQDVRVRYEFGKVFGPAIIPPHSSTTLFANSGEYSRPYYQIGVSEIDDVKCQAVPALSS